MRPTRDRAGTSRVDIGGSQNFLNACRAAKVGHIMYLSSHTVYGAHRDNPLPLDESSPLRPLFDFQYSWDKVETERLLQDFAASNPGIALTILRSCPVVGKGAVNSVAALMFKPPVMIAVKGFDPPMQFVHEDDLVELMAKLLVERRAGTYNVAGDGTINYGELATLARKHTLRLPQRLLELLISVSWRLRLQSDSPPSGLEFIKYPPVISTKRLRKETGFAFRYSSQEAIAAFLSG